MPAIRGSGSGGQSKEIHAVPSADPGVLGLPSRYSEPTADFPSREAEKIQQLAQHLLHQSKVSVRDLARFVGKTSAATRCFAKGSNGITVQMKLDNVTAVTYINKLGENSLSTIVPTGIDNLGVVFTEECLSGSRIPTWEGQHNSRSGIAINKRSLRLDVKSPGLPEDSTADGATANRSICIPTDKATTELLQLETGPRSNCDRRIQPELGPDERFCQSTMVPDSPLPEPDKETNGEGRDNHPSQPWYPIILGMLEDYPRILPAGEDLVILPTSQDFIMNQGVPELVAWPVSGNPSDHEEFLRRLRPSVLLASWRPKTQSNYDSLFSKWSRWCSQRNRNPVEGPVEDVANFLADLFKEGYLYRSLNSYRSAISALYSKVDGYSVGQHPLITRMLKGVFNERPPVAKYSAFWDVGMVQKYLKGLGTDDTLSLRLLTIKLVMLMALTRPARSVDLSKLDIGARSFSQAGVTFKALHLSKQSRASKPLADFFYPRYPEDPTICPVVTLQAYEARKLEFRAWSTENRKSLLFLSWIGKHDPVTGSTIARWLKMCLTEAGINTEIFKAHSVRGTSSSTAAAAGVTTADILKTADWSSAGTFQNFIFVQLRVQMTDYPLEQQCCHLLKLQTYILILRRSLPKCNLRMAQGT